MYLPRFRTRSGKRGTRNTRSRRYGATLVLFAVGLLLLLFCVAIAVDVGSVMVVKTQLQSAADASALAAASKLGLDRSVIVAEAKFYAESNKKVGGGGSELKDADVVVGVWHRAGEGQKGWFEPKSSGNAVEVTTRSTAQGTFFMPVFKTQSFDSAARAIACAVPRDIVFVMDLSGSMDDDSDPAWATDAIESTYGGAGQAMANELYTDLFPSGTGTEFNLMTYLQGRGHSVAGPDYAYAVLTADDGPLVADGIINPGQYVPDPATYTPALREAFRTLTYISGDNEITRRNKAYDWLLTKLHAPNPSLTHTF